MSGIKKSGIVKWIIRTVAIIIFGLLLAGGIYIFKKFGVNPDAWVEYIRSFGIFSGIILLFFQVLQVFLAIIPGEVIEIVSGCIFSPLLACLICYLGVFLASALIFFMVRKLGKRFSSIFVTEAKLKSLRFINTKEKLKRTTFLLFLIPGTPKDLLTYFFALAPIKYGDFFAITAFARFPSIISSVVGGKFLGDGEYIKAIVIFVITAFVSVLGLILYDLLKKQLSKRNALYLSKVKFSVLYKKFRIRKNNKFIKRIKDLKKKRASDFKIKILKEKSFFRPTKVLKIPKSLSAFNSHNL